VPSVFVLSKFYGVPHKRNNILIVGLDGKVGAGPPISLGRVTTRPRALKWSAPRGQRATSFLWIRSGSSFSPVWARCTRPRAAASRPYRTSCDSFFRISFVTVMGVAPFYAELRERLIRARMPATVAPPAITSATPPRMTVATCSDRPSASKDQSMWCGRG
jgi:hypothetical protein